MGSSSGQILIEMFDAMLNHFGHQHWWPGDTFLEIMVGTILTQNTNWNNVEKAIKNLKAENLLSIKAIHETSLQSLAEKIRPAGYYNIKARRLKNLIKFILERYDGNLSEMLEDDQDSLRKGLISVNGVGPETADSILLYATNHPVFVIDAYTYRILNRHSLAGDQVEYSELQSFFMDNLPEDINLFNEFHALIVRTGKEYCRKEPSCNFCPLKGWGTGTAISE